MQWFKNLKIARKLLLSFSVVLLLTTVLGIFSIYTLGQVNQSSTDMELNWMPSVRLSSELNTQLSVFRNNELQHVLSNDEASKADYDKLMVDLLAAIDKNRAAYERLISNSEERQRYNDFLNSWNEYLKENKKILELSRGHMNEMARELTRQASRQTYEQARAHLAQIVEDNAQGGIKASAYASELYEQSRLLVIGLLVTVLALGIAAALYVARAISAPLAEAVRISESVARGDLTSTIMVSSRDETGLLMQALKNMNDNLAQIVSQVRAGTQTIASASSQIASGNMDLSSRTEQQASSLEETASSTEELTSIVRQNADNARQANQLAVAASEVASRGGDVVSQVVHTMEDIHESSKKIVDIISVIDGIAFQTNILALNAAVEAARAGEQGRGFAVVASEVRSLAQRSASAAKEIKELIGNSVEKVGSGSKLVAEAGSTMEEVVGSVRRMTDIMSEISAASAEQASGIEQVNQTVTQMDQVTQQNAALVEEAAAAAQSLQEQATVLANLVSTFKLTAHVEPVLPATSRTGAPVIPVQTSEAPVSRARLHVSAPASAATATKSARQLSAASGDDWEEF